MRGGLPRGLKELEPALALAAVRALSFYCPRCGRVVEPPPGSRAVLLYVRGVLSLREARRAAVIAHYRHSHTGYRDSRDEQFMSPEERREYERALKARASCLRRGDLKGALEHLRAAREIRSRAHERRKKRFNKRAAELAKRDGLLP